VVDTIPLTIPAQGPEPVIVPTIPVVLIVALGTEPNSIFLSSIAKVDVLIVVVVPLTVKLPVTTKSLLIVEVPVDAPIDNTVAAPAKFTVVAVVLSKAKDVLEVVNDVVITGLILKTNTPVPVSSVIVVAKLALDGVAKNVATPVANPEIPVLIGVVTVILAEPSNDVPLIVTAVANLVVVDELPAKVVAVTVPVKVGDARGALIVSK
jgi:hypothetical protein